MFVVTPMIFCAPGTSPSPNCEHNTVTAPESPSVFGAAAFSDIFAPGEPSRIGVCRKALSAFGQRDWLRGSTGDAPCRARAGSRTMCIKPTHRLVTASGGSFYGSSPEQGRITAQAERMESSRPTNTRVPVMSRQQSGICGLPSVSPTAKRGSNLSWPRGGKAYTRHSRLTAMMVAGRNAAHDEYHQSSMLAGSSPVEASHFPISTPAPLLGSRRRVSTGIAVPPGVGLIYEHGSQDRPRGMANPLCTATGTSGHRRIDLRISLLPPDNTRTCSPFPPPARVLP